MIYFSPGTGPHPVRGAILQAYAQQGYERGVLGYPRGAETPPANGVAVQQFQNGQLSFSFATGRVTMPGGGYPDDDAVPRVGAIAWWASYGNGYGHVALVTAVNPGGYSVTRNMRAEAYLY